MFLHNILNNSKTLAKSNFRRTLNRAIKTGKATKTPGNLANERNSRRIKYLNLYGLPRRFKIGYEANVQLNLRKRTTSAKLNDKRYFKEIQEKAKRYSLRTIRSNILISSRLQKSKIFILITQYFDFDNKREYFRQQIA